MISFITYYIYNYICFICDINKYLFIEVRMRDFLLPDSESWIQDSWGNASFGGFWISHRVVITL